ncbi:MAG TPA: hypothetical protein VLL52_07455 [Anaerolineae bacterium]|nr:hypothetical protein [Anaerolineae bacterium]
MKFIANINHFAGQAVINPYYKHPGIFFIDPQPKKNYLITISLTPTEVKQYGLSNFVEQHSQAYFASNDNHSLAKKLPLLTSDHWQYTQLSDLLDDTIIVPSRIYWQFGQQFSLADFTAFAQEHFPNLRQKMVTANTLSQPNEKSEALQTLLNVIKPISKIINNASTRIQEEYNTLLADLEKPQVTALLATPFDFDHWLTAVANLQTTSHHRTILHQMMHHLLAQNIKPSQLEPYLHRIHQHTHLANSLTYDYKFWRIIDHHIHLDTNIQDQTIDISTAQLVRTSLNWSLITGHRVGRLVPRRRALTIFTRGQKPNIYIGASHAFKFKVWQAGGRLQQWGNTFILGQEDNNFYQLLLQAEQLQTLAYIAPQQALDQITPLNLPPNHPIHTAAAQAAQSYNHATIFADLLIETILGLDADIAHQLIRQQEKKFK